MNFLSTAVLAVLLAGASAAEEAVNPFQAAGDESQECYGWAADGQCVANPGHMLKSCKYSCWEWYAHRKKAYPDAAIDKDFSCHGWASQGECGKNPVFMKDTCPESCKESGYEPPPTPPAEGVPKKKKKKSKRRKKDGGGSAEKDEV